VLAAEADKIHTQKISNNCSEVSEISYASRLSLINIWEYIGISNTL